MPKDGVEPSWDCSRQILSLVRIPISPLRHELKMIELFGLARQDAKFVFRRSMLVYAAPPEFERKRLREILFMC